MTNNELLKIKDRKEKFYMLRKEIVSASYKEEQSRMINPSIKESILDLLEWNEFDLEDKGTQYLVSLILIFFHERKLYRRKDIEDKSYWDLTDLSNEHYGMIGTSKEEVINSILNSIKNSEMKDDTIEEIVYEIADKYGCYGRDRDDRKRTPYTRMLKK